MTALALINNTATPRWCYTNTGPSTAVTNTTAETVFDQIFTLPDQAEHLYVAPASVRIECYGVFSTGTLFTGLTLRLRLGGLTGTLLASTGSFSAPASQTDAGWYFDSMLNFTTIGSSAVCEPQGQVQMQSGLLSIAAAQLASTSSVATDLSADRDLVLTAQWGTATANNSIQLRTEFIEMNGP